MIARVFIRDNRLAKPDHAASSVKSLAPRDYKSKMATDTDLNAGEIDVTSAVLMAGAHHYGIYCQERNDAFMQCRMDSKDPRKCIEEGKDVTKCALDFFRKVKGSCGEVFTEHWTCLEYKNQDFSHCRKTQKAFDECMSDKLGLKRVKKS